MAPEVLTGKNGTKIVYEGSIDVYSFGVVIIKLNILFEIIFVDTPDKCGRKK